jgi:AraC-like DNA-binding protein
LAFILKVSSDSIVPAFRPNEITLLDFPRPEGGPFFHGTLPGDLPASGLPGWQSNGGGYRGHPAKALPFTLELNELPPGIQRIHLLGVFALFASRSEEALGTLGASLHLLDERDVIWRQDLLNGRHYDDALRGTPIDRSNGDGTALRTVGTVDDATCVDLLSIDIPADLPARSMRFKDLGSPASFVLFDIFVEHAALSGCPFSGRRGGIALAEIPSIVRVGDRVRFNRAVEQLETSLSQADDLDEARGQALTFLAMVTAASLEKGGPRQMHRVQLEAARALDQVTTQEQVAAKAYEIVSELAHTLFPEPQSPSAYLVDRALTLVERNFSKDLSDSGVATQLGLSTSHFRFLFKEATGQPFHKYLVALRLEKAKQMLLEQDLPISEVARAVGFGGLSHFSRAFTQRFSVTPTSIRRGGA